MEKTNQISIEQANEAAQAEETARNETDLRTLREHDLVVVGGGSDGVVYW